MRHTIGRDVLVFGIGQLVEEIATDGHPSTNSIAWGRAVLEEAELSIESVGGESNTSVDPSEAVEELLRAMKEGGTKSVREYCNRWARRELTLVLKNLLPPG